MVFEQRPVIPKTIRAAATSVRAIVQAKVMVICATSTARSIARKGHVGGATRSDEMEERDQAARVAWIEDISDRDGPQLRAVEEIDTANLRRLKHILQQDGFPMAAMVGYNGVSSAWLLMQHADTDPAFQARWLPVIAKRAGSGDLSMQQYAFLTDRVLWHPG